MPALLDNIEQKSFLGSEFVTWLWFQSEREGGAVELDEDKPCLVEFEKDLVLSSEAGDAQSSTLRGEAPTLAPEATAALAAGKKVKRARVRLTFGDAAWEAVLDAENFDWRGLKIDVPPSLPFNESLPLRLAVLQEFHSVFDRLFGRFLDVRLDPDGWEAELGAMREWIAERGEEAE